MAYLLDTNACSDYFTGRYPRVVARIQACSPDDLRLSLSPSRNLPVDRVLR
jgi:predicted nucleic acid-binding protein